MARKLEHWDEKVEARSSGKRTPAINRPKAIPRWFQLSMPKDVSAGLHRLPGDSVLETPSMRTTTTTRIVEIIPSTEVMDNKDSGKNTVGMRLGCVSEWAEKETDGLT